MNASERIYESVVNPLRDVGPITFAVGSSLDVGTIVAVSAVTHDEVSAQADEPGWVSLTLPYPGRFRD